MQESRKMFNYRYRGKQCHKTKLNVFLLLITLILHKQYDQSASSSLSSLIKPAHCFSQSDEVGADFALDSEQIEKIPPKATRNSNHKTLRNTFIQQLDKEQQLEHNSDSFVLRPKNQKLSARHLIPGMPLTYPAKFDSAPVQGGVSSNNNYITSQQDKTSYPVYNHSIISRNSNLHHQNMNNLNLAGVHSSSMMQNGLSMQNEILFSNQTGLVLQCTVARDLARAIEKANQQAISMTSQQFMHQSASGPSAHQANQKSGRPIGGHWQNSADNLNGPIQIRWEKCDSGEQIEHILYSGSQHQASFPNQQQLYSSANGDSPHLTTVHEQQHQHPNVIDQNQDLSQESRNERILGQANILRQVRPRDGALVIEPFQAHDFRPDVHQTGYRCVAWSPLHGASMVSRDFRVRATTGGGQVVPVVMDVMVFEGNEAHLKCQIVPKNPAPATTTTNYQSSLKDQYQVLDWIVYPSESVYSAHSTTFNYASQQLFRDNNSKSQQSAGSSKSQANDNSQPIGNASSSFIRFLVAPQTGDLHILNVDSSLKYQSFGCRIKNRITGEIIVSPSAGKLLITDSHSPVSPRLQLDQPQTNNVYLQGQLAVLACSGQAYPKAQVQWSRLIKMSPEQSSASVLQPIDFGPRSQSTEFQPIVNGEFAQIGSLLIINSLHRNHSGIYVCQASNSVGEERMELELLVRAPLKVKLTTSPANVLELGKSLSLDCAISGYPVEEIVFKHNQQVIKSISGSSSSSSSHSQYKPNSAAKSMATFNNGELQDASPQPRASSRLLNSAALTANALDSSSAPNSGYFVVDEQQIKANQNGPDSSNEADLDSTLVDSHWLGQDSAEQQSQAASATSPKSSSSSLNHVIVIVLEPQHTGAYQCFAHSQFESAHSSAYVRVLDDPPKFKETFRAQVFEQHQDISLQCSARANPLPEITWTLDDAPLPESGRIRIGDFVTKDNLLVSYVNITNAEVADMGQYRCTADNGLAQIGHEAQISISGPLQVKPTANITVLSAGTLRARCPVAGYPITDIQWFHNERRLPANHRQRVFENGTLEVEHMERAQSDDGLYSCLASSTPAANNPAALGPQDAPSQTALALASTSNNNNNVNVNNNNQLGAGKQQAYGSVNVSIKAKPTIAPFQISSSLREGERATVSCTVSSGDLPIEISWFRNGHPIWASSAAAAAATSGELTNYGQAIERQQLLSSGNSKSAPASPNAKLSGVRIIGVSEYSSTLLFESLTVDHSGNYTCLAQNAAGQSSHHSQMIIQVAPKWTMEPSDSSVTRGSSMAIDCAASGYPLPRVIWTKANGQAPALQQAQSASSSLLSNALDWLSAKSQDGQQQQREVAASKSQQLGSWRSIVSSPHLQVFENGSLNLIDARDLDQGYYMCQASNGVGPGLSKVIKVIVNVAAQFNGAHHSTQFVVQGEQAQLKCQVRGDWPLTLHWFRGRNRLEPINGQEEPATSANQNQNQNHHEPAKYLSSTSSSVLLIPGSSSPSSWSLAQLRSNARAGMSMIDQLASLINVQSEHMKSKANGQDLEQSQVGGMLIPRLSIETSEQLISGDASHAQITSFRENNNNNNNLPNSINRANIGQMSSQQQINVQLTSTLKIMQADRSDTNVYKCLAANHFGVDERTVQLIVQDKPDRIEEISVNESQSRTIIIGWLAPHDGNSPITNYHIQYKVAPEQHQHHSLANAVNVIPQQNSLEFHLDSSWVNYSLPVSSSQAAYFNLSTMPIPSQQQQAQSSSTSQHGLQINNQQQQLSPKASVSSTPTSPAGSRALFKVSINALRPLTRYWFRVNAENKLGLGPISRIFEANTLDEAPSMAPNKVKALPKSSSTILVSWSRMPEKSEREFNSQIQGYYVGYKLASSSTSPDSNSLNTEANNNQTLATQQQVSKEVAPIIYKTIQQDEKSSNYEALISGLKRSSKYLVTVQAFNARGTGPSSEPILVRTLEMDPPRHVKLRVRQSTNSSLELDWSPLSQAAVDAAENNNIDNQSKAKGQQQQQQFDASQIGGAGGGPSVIINQHAATSSKQLAKDSADLNEMTPDQVDYYTLFQAELNDQQPRWSETQVSGSSSSFQIENLKCGTKYQFQMFGVNRIGRGEQSDVLETKTLGGTPILPDRQSCFEVINSTCFIIRLDAWQDNRCAIQEYSVQYRRESEPTSLSINGVNSPPRNDWINLANIKINGNSVEGVNQLQPNKTALNADLSASVEPGKQAIRQRRWTPPLPTTTSSQNPSDNDNAMDNEDAAYMLDYPSNSMMDAASTNQADNLMLMADYSGDSMVNQGSGSSANHSSAMVDEPSFSFLSESILPAFESLPDLVQESGDGPADDLMQFNSVNTWSSEPGSSTLPTTFKSQTINQVQRKHQQIMKTRSVPRASTDLSQSASSIANDHHPTTADWRRVRLCNLNPNSLYTIQMTAINSVGPTEAQLNLWTSPDGIEYDPISKRNVVSRYGPGGSRMVHSQGKSRNNRHGNFEPTSFDASMLNNLSQWPVLIPMFLAIALVGTILVVMLLLRHNQQNQNQSNRDKYRSNASSTTNSTTTNTNMSSESTQNCQNFLHPLNNQHQPLNQGHHYFEQAPSSSISEAGATIAPSGFAPSEMGDVQSTSLVNNHHQQHQSLGNPNDTYAMVSQRLGLNPVSTTTFQPHLSHQQNSMHLVNNCEDEPSYGIVGYGPEQSGAHISNNNNLTGSNYATNTLTMGRQQTDASTLNHGQAIIISNSLQDSMTLPHNHQSRPRNVLLCQTGRVFGNRSNTLKHPGDHQSNNAAQFYGILSQVAAQQRASIYASNQQQQQQNHDRGLDDYILSGNPQLTSMDHNCNTLGDLAKPISETTKLVNGKNFSHSIFQNGQLVSNVDETINNPFPMMDSQAETNNSLHQANLHIGKQQQQYDNCFMTIVDEVARATDTLRNNSHHQNSQIHQHLDNSAASSNHENEVSSGAQTGPNKVQLVERRCNQPDCFSLHQV